MRRGDGYVTTRKRLLRTTPLTTDLLRVEERTICSYGRQTGLKKDGVSFFLPKNINACMSGRYITDPRIEALEGDNEQRKKKKPKKLPLCMGKNKLSTIVALRHLLHCLSQSAYILKFQ